MRFTKNVIVTNVTTTKTNNKCTKQKQEESNESK